MTTSTTLRYETCDVFTTVAFGGNPLAVVFGAEALAAETMQKVAAEFNYSETTFVLPPEDPSNTAHVRIFTPVAELPFAGHPNVGTASCWRGRARPSASRSAVRWPSRSRRAWCASA